MEWIWYLGAALPEKSSNTVLSVQPVCIKRKSATAVRTFQNSTPKVSGAYALTLLLRTDFFQLCSILAFSSVLTTFIFSPEVITS